MNDCEHNAVLCECQAAELRAERDAALAEVEKLELTHKAEVDQLKRWLDDARAQLAALTRERDQTSA